MQLDVDELGTHDLVAIAFKDPYNRPMDSEYRDRMFQRLVGKRMVIIVEGEEKPVRYLSPDIIGSPPPPEVTFGIPVSFAAASVQMDTHPSKRFLASARGQPNDVFNYQIWVSNYDGDEPVEYALMLFLDFRQLPFDNQNVLLTYLKAGHEAIIDQSLSLPAEAGIHELQVVYVLDPYRSILHHEVTSPSVLGSNCVGIEVQR